MLNSTYYELNVSLFFEVFNLNFFFLTFLPSIGRHAKRATKRSLQFLPEDQRPWIRSVSADRFSFYLHRQTDRQADRERERERERERQTNRAKMRI